MNDFLYRLANIWNLKKKRFSENFPELEFVLILQMASCCAAGLRVSGAVGGAHRTHEKAMAEKLFEWADKGLISARPIWNKRNEHADPHQCGIYRPDFVLERDAGVVIEECDENGHQSYKIRCELIRQAHISLGYGGRPVHWIRIDTDTARIFGSITLDSTARDDIHLRQLQMAERNPDYDHFIKIDYLFYRPMFGMVGDIVQSFEFPTIEDYCKWVDKVAPETISMQNAIKQRESGKKTWLISYRASGQNITHSNWNSMTKISIDECYTLAQRDMKYTLVHATKRVTAYAIGKAIGKLEQETGIKRFSIFGYGEISSGGDITEHPGMKLIIEHVNKQSPLLESWLECGDIRSNKRGILNRFLVSVDLNQMTRIQLLNYIRDYKQSTEQELSEHEQKHVKDEEELNKRMQKIKELKRLRTEDQKEMDEMEQELNARMDRIKALKIEVNTLKSLLQ